VTEPKDIRKLPLSQLTDDELRQRLENTVAEYALMSARSLADQVALQGLMTGIREDIRQIEGERRYRSETRNQDAALALSQGMLDVARSTLKVYEWLKWLTVVLALATLVQVFVAIFKH
jgi:hypothetical protein